MTAVFFGFLCHETHVGDVAHGGGIELTVGTAIVHDGLVKGSVTTIGNQTFGVFQGVVRVPHTTAVTNHIWHGSVNDDVGRDVQIGNAFARIDHGQFGACFIRRHDVSFHFGLFGMSLNFIVHITQTIVWIDFQFFKQRGMFGKHVFVIHFDNVPKHDWVGHFHHGCF